MSNFRIILILVLGIAIIEALPVSKPTLKPNGKSISKLSVFRSKNKSLLAEEKKIGKAKASKIAVENAEESKIADRKKKATTFCVEIRPDPVNKVCDPASATVVHEHHVHQASPPANPIPPASPAPPMNPEVPDVPIVIETPPEPSVIIKPPPPSHQFILQPQPPINCIHSSVGPCPPSIYPSGYAHQSLQSPDPVRNFFFATDPMIGVRGVETPTNHIEQPVQQPQPYHGARFIPVAVPEIPVNPATPQQQQDYPIHSAVQASYPASVPSQNLRQYQTLPCGSARSSTADIEGITPSEIVEDLPIPTGPVMPPPATSWPLGGPRGPPLYPMAAVLSDVSNFRMISNSPDAEIPVGYQAIYHSYDRPQGLSGSPIASGQGAYGQRIRLQREQTEEPKIDEDQEKSTSTPASLTFGDMINRMRVSQDSWRSSPTMQSFPREKTDQMQQLRAQAAQVNVNLPSADYPTVPEINVNSDDQSVVSNLKEIGQKAIESSLNASESKQQ